jgi:FAD/FMN-containing dehydrogenase
MSASVRSLLPSVYTPETGHDGPGVFVNDIHSRLNPTRVARAITVENEAHVVSVVNAARNARLPICISGGRHAMGGQQFASGAVLIDTRAMRRVLDFDSVRGIVEVEAGIQWPELVSWLRRAQRGARTAWTIAQKQTGADRLSVGGAVAANVHGRGLTMLPFVDDVEALTVVDARGELLRCSRTERPELFRHVVGGYGLFGAVTSVALRLVPRRQLERVVEVRTIDGLIEAFERRIAAGHLYGDFQFAVDHASRDFLYRGVLSTYRPVEDPRPISEDQRSLSNDDWRRLLTLAHMDKSTAFREYAAHYTATSGQRYWSDDHQMGVYLDDYHVDLDRHMGACVPGTEMITEVYVPRERLTDFMLSAAETLRGHDANVIYGTVRLIEQDEATALPWARGRWACVIFNLHVDHTEEGLDRAAGSFRALIDLAAVRGGSYYLTYHRWATREQLLECHPSFPDWMAAKRRRDPDGLWQSDWWRCMETLMRD